MARKTRKRSLITIVTACSLWSGIAFATADVPMIYSLFSTIECQQLVSTNAPQVCAEAGVMLSSQSQKEIEIPLKWPFVGTKPQVIVMSVAFDYQFSEGAGSRLMIYEGDRVAGQISPKNKLSGKYEVSLGDASGSGKIRLELTSENPQIASVALSNVTGGIIQNGQQVGMLAPHKSVPGKTLDVDMQFELGKWATGDTTVDFGQEITVEALQIHSPSHATARIRIAPDAKPGPKMVKIRSKGEWVAVQFYVVKPTD